VTRFWWWVDLLSRQLGRVASADDEWRTTRCWRRDAGMTE